MFGAMDTAMAHHYSNLTPDAAYSSLHDDFLQDIHETVGSVRGAFNSSHPRVNHPARAFLMRHVKWMFTTVAKVAMATTCSLSEVRSLSVA